MESVYLKQLVKNSPKGGPSDINAPFSFLEWKERSPYITEKDEVFHYNTYVQAWFANNKEKTVSQKFLLRQKYLYLLEQLQLFFTEEEKNTWYSQVNLADEKELLLAIPYFARKLRDVALYYLKLRKKLKNTKLKYNTVGTTTGLEQEIYSYFLETFSTSNNENSSTLFTTLPDLSSLQNSLVVQVEELYDDKQYFDLSPTKPLSSYFDLLSQSTGEFLATKGIILSSSEWLFESFNIPVSSSFDSFVSQLTGNIFELSDTNLYGSFIQKYIAENKYSLAFTAASSVIEVTDVSIAEGNNYFYYPYGTTDASTSIPKQISVVALSSLTPVSATAGLSIETSDTIFVKNGDDIKSAWFRYQDYEETSKTVKASLKKDNTTSFIFPYPGYGLSGQDLPWTGSSFETNAEYNFLTKELKAQVNEAYWSQELPNDSCESIMLNNTTLVSSGATPNTNPSFADQFFTRLTRNAETSTPFGELSGSWLYKLDKTALPVSPNQPNVFLWPYNVADTTQEYPEYLKKISYSEACNSVSINDLSKSYFIAASSFDLADKIYKINNYADSTQDALECAWLSGSSVTINGYRYTDQDGFAALFPAGEATRFIWTGPETTLESVFRSAQHRKDCPFVTNVPTVSAFEWQKCSCKQVYHSPFGHSSKIFEKENSFADCIIQDTENNLNPFDFSSWRDTINKPFFSSLEFAWYKTNSNHSWGNGQWVSNKSLTTAPFTLKPGKTYFYKRSNDRTNTEPMPSYVVNYSFNTNNTKWIAGKLGLDGSWTSADKDSLMFFYPGDFVKYDRQKQTTSYLLSTVKVENVSTNKGSVWSAFDYIAVGSTSNSTVLSWPIETIPFGSTDSQYPAVPFTDISSIYGWTITREGVNPESQTIYGERTITFVPPTTGTYTVSVTANVRMTSLSSVTYSKATSATGLKFAFDNDVNRQVTYAIDGNNVIFTFQPYSTTNAVASSIVIPTTQIPRITAVPQYSTEYFELEFGTPSSGFLMEHPLKGWNYNTYKIDSKANGARPYWATLDTQKNSTTRSKGVYSWGYPDNYIDGYLPNSNPIFSPVEISYGTIVEYFRKGYSFNWNQPIAFKEFVGTTQWCEISSSTSQISNLSAFYESKQNAELNVIVKNTPTDILLSNTLNGAPVEIFYYALNSFVWPISVEVLQDVVPPTSAVYFESQAPWTTLTNRFYPTIANVPVVDETYSLEDVGGYFLPQHLGASQFINKDFATELVTTNLSGTFLTEDINIHVGGRGQTKQDQDSLYTWTENNQWLKESATTGNLAGAVKKSLTKALQTFVPYQSNNDQTSLGLVTPQSKLSPWGGVNDEEWMDVLNEPMGFTGVRNVSAWVASQVLKQNQKAVDCWSSDVYGNQYGVFKQLNNVPIADHINTTGELWTRTNDQSVDPAYLSLSAVFEPFKTVNLTVYKQLTGNGVKYADCYFDTIFIETSGAALFAKIDYDFDNTLISSTFDDTRYKLLSNNFRFERNWFFPPEKKVISLYTEIIGTKFRPTLYEFDLPSRKYKKVFPINLTNTNSLTAGVNSINIKNLSRGAIHYNRSLDTYLITYTGTDTNDKMFIADFYIKPEENLNLTKINLYKDFYNSSAINEPPIVLTPYLSAIRVGLDTFTVKVSALNSPTSYSLLNYTTKVAVNNLGTFVGKLSAGIHHINYTVSNQVGNSIYCLTLSAS